MITFEEQVSQFLDGLPIFCDLTPSQLESARAVLSVKRVKAGHRLMSVDAVSDNTVYIVADGSVKICVHDGDSDVMIGIRGPGEVIGEMSVLDGKNRSATVIAQEDSMLLWMSHADFWDVLWEMPPIPYNFARMLTQRTRVLTSQVQALSTLDVQGRLARQLVVLAEEYGQPYPEKGEAARLVPFQLKQAELAAMIGSTREQVNQLLSSWRRRGFIARDRVRNAHIVVCRADALRNYY